eukprot:1151199-Pelagomonas_calceolata.AAC.2
MRHYRTFLRNSFFDGGLIKHKITLHTFKGMHPDVGMIAVRTPSQQMVRNRNHKQPELGKPSVLVMNYTESTELKRSVLSNNTPKLELQISCQKDPAVHKILRKPVSSCITPISDQAWRNHNKKLLNHPSPSNNDTHGLHNEAAGDTDPHPFNLPGEVDLNSLVSTHISNMSTSPSPGFNTVLHPLIKYACKLIPRHHGKGLENYNVLAPQISQLLTLMLKMASASPPSGKLPTCTNIQKGRCDTSFKLPDACSRNTLQPHFILRHLNHAAQTLQPQGSPHLYAIFIDFKQVYDSITRVRLWEHSQKCQMPSQLISIIKDLYQDEKHILIDRDNLSETGEC